MLLIDASSFSRIDKPQKRKRKRKEEVSIN
jgi:hypothetical protein